MGKKQTKTKHVFVTAVLTCLFVGQLFVLHLAFADPHISPSTPVKEMPFQIISLNNQLISPLSSLNISDTTPFLKGQASSGSLIIVAIQGMQQYITHTTSADTHGSWTVPFITPLASGSYTVHAIGNNAQTQNATFSIHTPSEVPSFQTQNKFLHVSIPQKNLFPSDVLEFTYQTQGLLHEVDTLFVTILNKNQDRIFSDMLDFQEMQLLTITLPHSIPPGEYTLHVATSQDNQQFSSTDSFTISPADTLTSLSLLLSTKPVFPIALTFLISGLLLTTIFLIKEMSQLTKRKGRV